MNDWVLSQNTCWTMAGGNRRKPPEQSFLDAWALHSAIWGSRHGVGEALDRYFGLHSPSVSSSLSCQAAELGIDDFEGKQSGPLGYRDILKLRNDYVPWKELSWKTFSDTVNKDTEPLRDQLKSAPIRDFFQDVPAKAFARETLWESNVKPFKDLLCGCKQNLFANLSYTAGVGLAGASIIKDGVQHYRYWHRQEKGNIASQWHTAYETGKAVCQKTIQSFASWEAAGLGMAIGRALIPIGAFPIGGILIGALFATTAYKAIGKLFPSLAKPGLSKN